MNTTLDFDRLLESALEVGGPEVVPSRVVDAALTTVLTTKQRRPRLSMLDRRAWPVDRWMRPNGFVPLSPSLTRVVLLALIATALVALGVVGAALLREDPVPKNLQSTFFRPFEYAIPVDSAMHITGTSPEMVAWAGGPDNWEGATLDATGGTSQPHPREVRGVVIGRGGEAWSHGNGGRFMLRTVPAEFLTDLHETANVPMGPVEQTTLDGSSALTTMLPGTGGTDIHVTGRSLGLSGTYVRVTIPSRLIVSEVHGTTVFILIWARTAGELDRWLPVADEFVTSIHFIPD